MYICIYIYTHNMYVYSISEGPDEVHEHAPGALPAEPRREEVLRLQAGRGQKQ